jgi:hypothetical protein
VADDNSDDSNVTSGGAAPPPAGKPARVVPLPLVPKQRKLNEAHLANLRASGLTDETIQAAELYTEDRPKALAELTQRRVWNRQQGSALVFPFYPPDPAAQVHAYRVRPSVPLWDTGPNGKRRQRKYDQASSHGLLVYFTPRARAARWYADPARVLYWTEGEKKALVLDQHGLACVGLTGVWNWIDKAHKDESGGEERLHAMIREHVALAGREHVIVFDADARKNDKVMMAAQRLAGVLVSAGAVSVRFVCPPDLEHKGIDDFYAAHGGAALDALLCTAEPIEPIAAKQLLAVRKCPALRDVEAIDPRHRVPDGYELQRDGSLWRTAVSERQGDARITASPLFVTRILVDAYTAEQRVDLAWCSSDGAPRTICASRRAISDSRTLVAELAGFGAPVTSGNAGKLVDWFESYTHTNAAAIGRVTSVASTGWHVVNGQRIFVADAPLGPDGTTPAVALDTRGDRQAMFAALTPRGELAEHIAAIKRAWDASPLAAAVIAAALAAPLLEPLKCPNFAVHLVGESSRGKTSMLKCAASVYGDPRSPQWVASWNVTPSGAELRAAALNDLPQCYDEVGGGDAQAAERLVYGLVNGGGRTRATRDLGMRPTASWRTIVLSTGERELADESTATGAQVRVVQLPVEGFGELTGTQVNAVRAACEAHAGSLGHAWLQEIASIEDWPHYRDALALLTASLTKAAADPLQERVAGYFAVLALVEMMASESFGIGEPQGGKLRALFESLGARENVQGVGERARDAVEQWVMSEPDAFPELQAGPHGGLDEPKSNGVRVRHGFRRPDGAIMVIASSFRTFMSKRARLAPRVVVREWSRLGWTEIDYGRLDKQIRIGKARGRYVLLSTSSHIDLPTSEGEE